MGIHTPTRDLSVRAISLHVSRIAYLESPRLGVELARPRDTRTPRQDLRGPPYAAPPCIALRGHAPQNAGPDDFPGDGIFVRGVLLNGSPFLIYYRIISPFFPMESDAVVTITTRFRARRCIIRSRREDSGFCELDANASDTVCSTTSGTADCCRRCVSRQNDNVSQL